MFKENAVIESSIANAKEMAGERQPIRHDVYLQHISYYEDCIRTLKAIIECMNQNDQAVRSLFCGDGNSVNPSQTFKSR